MSNIKIIQVNIFKGKYLDLLIEFIKKESPDFISMQEVTVGGFNLCNDKTLDLFEVLKNRLGMYGIYHGDLKLKRDERSVFGNAVFSRYKILEKEVIALKTFRAVSIEEPDGATAGEIRPQIARHLLCAEIEFGEKRIKILSWHGAWTAPPVDTQETLKQAKIVADYLGKLREPFVMGGDLNNVIGSKTVELIDNVANNLMIGKGIKETTNPKVHKIAPMGFMIDYIFTSPHFTLESLEVPRVTVSDHLPVVARLRL